MAAMLPRLSMRHSRPSSAVIAQGMPLATTTSTGWPRPSAVSGPPTWVNPYPARAIKAGVQGERHNLAAFHIDAIDLLGHSIQRKEHPPGHIQIGQLLKEVTRHILGRACLQRIGSNAPVGCVCHIDTLG